MNEIYYSKGYEELKQELKEELGKSVESFVRIGYLLKVARDTDILTNSPYANMEEFAYAEFKLDKGTASKFMAINDRFSEGGNSDHLLPEYNGIGWSKLSIMLQLPDSINEEITENFSKSEIQAIRDEVAEEEKITPLETMLEGENPYTAAEEDILAKTVLQLGESEPELFTRIYDAVYEEDAEALRRVLAPSGEMMYSVRIRGVGRILLSLKDYEENISLINERTGEKERRTWTELWEQWKGLLQNKFPDGGPEETWTSIYERSFPKPEKKEEVAPVQPKKEEKKKPTEKEKKKVKKVNSPKPEKKGKPEPEKSPENLRAKAPSIPEKEPAPEVGQEEPEEAPAGTAVQMDENAIKINMLMYDLKDLIGGKITDMPLWKQMKIRNISSELAEKIKQFMEQDKEEEEDE